MTRVSGQRYRADALRQLIPHVRWGYKRIARRSREKQHGVNPSPY